MRLQTEKISSPESAIQNHIQNIILSEVNLASNLNLQGIPSYGTYLFCIAVLFNA